MTIRPILLAVWLAFACLSPVSAVPALAADSTAQVDRPRIMMMLKLAPEHFRAGSSYGGDYGDAMGQQARLRVARRIAREHRLTLLGNWPMQDIGVDCVILAVNDGRTAQVAADEVSSLPGVAWSQPLNEFRMQGAAAAPHAAQNGRPAYNDSLLRAQPVVSRWHLSSLHRFSTGRGQTIAIVDSRIDANHPDLLGQIATVQDFVPGDRRAPERHGTGVAGIIAALPNNAKGIAGVAPGARILGLRACWERPMGGATVCDSLSLAKALTYALDHHADVINLSLSGPQDRLLQTLIGIGISRGATVVAAVDQSQQGISFPASVVGVVRVGDERLSSRETGVYIAPGLDIPTTEPEGQWSLVNGSSYAAAHVSGLAALLRQLSGTRGTGQLALGALGVPGAIDTCALMARVSTLDARQCRTAN